MRQITEVSIKFIPQEDQRYDTCGDWTVNDGGLLTVLVSKMPDNRHELLVAVHELVEALACLATGVTQQAVDDFDMGPGADLDEPGDCPAAPYHQQHVMATEIEMLLAAGMGVDWAGYDAAVGDHGLKEPACPT
jgi:hypothetical protein